ncbi:MAG: hypothetical protein OEY10_00125 [Nitrosopumilus sp.]|nr:hypothetical protein [Nitrosopumilus sp.]
MENKCPHCGKENCILSQAIDNVEFYGSAYFHLPCIHCKKMIHVGLARKVDLHHISASNKPREESNF